MNTMAGKEISAFTLIVVILTAVPGPPASAQAADAKQPSVENPHMHLWGTDNIGQCWTHFDANETTSAVEGYGEKEFAENQQVDVNFNCAMSDSFKADMYLNPNGTIRVDVGLYIASGDCSDTAECQELRISLLKGSTIVAQEEFATNNNYDENQIIWEIPVSDNMTRWNKSFEEPQLQFEYSKPNPADFTCVIFDCSGYFGVYYSNNEDGMDTEILFPVINASDPIAVGGDGPPPSTGDSGLPGFGLLAGVGSMAIGAVAASRLHRED